MLIKVVIENTSAQGLPTEHGLCLWVEACRRRFFFDLGQSALFAENAANMGIKAQDAEFVVVSHGHYDHGGGIPAFLSLNDGAPIYLHKKAFTKHYSLKDGGAKYIGLAQDLQGNGRIRPTDGVQSISDGITLFAGCSGNEYFSPANIRILKSEGGKLVCDDFCHEQSLIIQEDECSVLLAGCAHSGILNIIAKAEEIIGKPITHVVAGMHLSGVADHSFIEGLANALKAKNRIYYTCHCTGVEAYNEMKSILGAQISHIATGDTIKI